MPNPHQPPRRWSGSVVSDHTIGNKLKAALAALDKHKQAVVPELKPVWTASLLGLIPELVQIAHCNYDQAKVSIGSG
jgi:hypothetical protein